MREISTKDLEIGEHVLIDGVEYVAEKGDCGDCEYSDICDWVMFCPVGGKLTKVEEKHDKDTPMTNLQLAEWLAKGNGQYRFRNKGSEWSLWVVSKDEEDFIVADDILIRTWDSEKWVIPTVDIYERDCKGGNK